MLELHSEVVVANGQHGQSLVTHLTWVLLSRLRKGRLQEFVLQQDDGQHHVLQGIFVAVQLAEYCAEIEMSVREGLRLIDFELEFECLDEVGEGSSDFACSAVVTG